MPAWLARSPHRAVLEALRAVAWADGSLDPAERTMVAELVGRLGVSVTDAELGAWLSAGEAGATDPGDVSAEDRFGLQLILSHAVRMASADGDYSADERARIREWATAWGFSPADLTELEDEVAAELAAPADPFA